MSDFAKGAIKATAGIMVISLISRILGFVREMFIAASFGAVMITDAYRMASIIPAIIFSSIAAAIGITFIPVLTEYFHGGDNAKTNRFVSNTINSALAVAAIFMVLGYIFADYLVAFVAPGFTEEAAHLTVRIIRIMFPIVLFNVVMVIATSYLHTKTSFFIPALAGLLFNLVIISQLAFFSHWGIEGLAVATMVGMAAQALVQIPFMMKSGFNYSLILDHRCEGLKKVFFLMLPVLMGTAIGQLNVTINQMMASGLPEGSISALDFGNRVNSMVNSLFGTSVATVLYPSMSRMAFENQIQRLKNVVSTGIRVVSFVTMPMAVGLMILAEPIVRLLFERGAFDSRATDMTSVALFYFAIAIVPLGIGGILGRVFFSMQDTKTPVLVGFTSVTVNIVLNLLLIGRMGHAGLAFSTAMASIVSVIMSMFFFRRKLGLIGGRQIVSSFAKQALSAALMGAVVFWLNTFMTEILPGYMATQQIIRLVITVTAGAAVYIAASFVLKVKEFSMALEMAKKFGGRILAKI